MEGVSGNLLSLRQLLYPHMFGEGGIRLAYDTVVGFWAPFGSFVTGLASYALGRAFWSQGAGLAALIATFLLPDACLLNIAHPTLAITGYSTPLRGLVWCSSRRNGPDTYRPRSA